MSCNDITPNFSDDNTSCNTGATCNQKCHEVVDTIAELPLIRNAFVTVREENAIYHVDEVGNAVLLSRDPIYAPGYTPVTGDYKSVMVYDTTNGIIYIFDPLGNYTQSVSKTYVDAAVATGGLSPVSDLVRLAVAQTLTNKLVSTGSTIDASVNVIEVLKKAYPIGAVYISVVSTNPATLFGFGTWVAFATGRTLVGVDNTQAEFTGVQTPGGEKTHLLTLNEMPSHNHSFDTINDDFNNLGGNPPGFTADGNGSRTWQTTYAGGGQPHNNLQPYITVYMFKRTS